MLDPQITQREKADLVDALTSGLHVDTNQESPFYACPLDLFAFVVRMGDKRYCKGNDVKEADEGRLRTICKTCNHYYRNK